MFKSCYKACTLRPAFAQSWLVQRPAPHRPAHQQIHRCPHLQSRLLSLSSVTIFDIRCGDRTPCECPGGHRLFFSGKRHEHIAEHIATQMHAPISKHITAHSTQQHTAHYSTQHKIKKTRLQKGFNLPCRDRD